MDWIVNELAEFLRKLPPWAAAVFVLTGGALFVYVKQILHRHKNHEDQRKRYASDARKLARKNRDRNIDITESMTMVEEWARRRRNGKA